MFIKRGEMSDEEDFTNCRYFCTNICDNDWDICYQSHEE